MLSFLGRRLGQMILILVIFITMTFFVLQAMPGDITSIFTGNPKVTPEMIAAIKARFGLDQPLGTQYVRYMKNMLTADMGVSFSQYPKPVWEIIVERLPRTLLLFFSAQIVSFYIGFVLGKLIAWRRGRLIDSLATTVGITFWTAFYPLVAFVLIWIFAFLLDWFPINGFIDPMVWYDATVSGNTIFLYLLYSLFVATAAVGGAFWAGQRWGKTPRLRRIIRWSVPLTVLAVVIVSWTVTGFGRYAWDILRHAMLPIGVLSLISFGGTMLLTRDSMLETIREDYVMAARAKGLPDRVVRDRYAARTAILPVMTSLALSLGYVVSGGLVTETLFSWPGLGLTLLDSALVADFPLAIGAFTFSGVFLLLAHLVADVLHAVLDPRLRTGHGAMH